MKQLLNITQTDRKNIIDQLAIVYRILNIENGVQTAACALNLVSASGTEISHHRAGNTAEKIFRGLDKEARSMNQLLHSRSEGNVENHTEIDQAEGVCFRNGLKMSFVGFTWPENKLAVLWIGYEMGWITLTDMRDIANQWPETVSEFMKLIRYFDLAAELAAA